MSVLRRNNVTLAGKGHQPMIFAHGYGCDQTMWRFIAPDFAPNYHLVLFDHVGSGKSDHSAYRRAKYTSLQAYADDVLEICDQLNVENGVFVGHSVSSMIGVLAAIKEPERFERLVLIGPSPCYINDDNYVGGFTREDIMELLELQDSNFLGWSSKLAPVIMENPEKPELTTELENSFCQMDPEIAKQFAAVTFLSDNREDLPKVSTESLILQCQNDAIAPLTVGQYVHDRLPKSRLVILNATGHCPHLSAPHETSVAMKAFLGV